MSVLGKLPGILAGAMGNTLFRAATLYSVTNRTVAGSGRNDRSRAPVPCRGLVVDYTDFQRASGNIPASDRKAMILAATCAAVPKPEDVLVVDGESWALLTVKSDPAGATYECQCRNTATPDGDATQITSSLLDVLPSILAGAMGQSLFSAGLVFSVTGRTSDGRGGYRNTYGLSSCRALVVDYTDFQRASGDIPAGDRLALILADTMTGRPRVGDVLKIDGECWALVELRSDPAKATWEGRCQRSPEPVVGIRGALATVIGQILLAAEGGSRVLGSSVINIDAITLAASGTPIVLGAANVSIGNITANAAGVETVLGVLATQMAPISVVGRGSPVLVGNLNVSIGAITTAAAGTETIQGALSVGIGAITPTAFASPVIQGALSSPIGAISVASIGGPTVSGALAITIPAFALVGAGTQENVGQLAAGIGNITLAATGVLTDVGAASTSIGAFTLAGVGVLTVVGALNVSIGNVTTTAAGTETIQGALAKTIGSIGLVAAGTQQIGATLSSSIGSFTLAGVGVIEDRGQLASTIGAITLTGAGSPVIQGALAVSIDPVTTASAGGSFITGSLAASIGSITLAGAGTSTIQGVLNTGIGAIATTAAGTETIQGNLAATLAAISLAGAGTSTIQGALNSTVSAIAIAAAGTSTVQGQLAATMAAFTLAGAGTVTPAGVAKDASFYGHGSNAGSTYNVTVSATIASNSNRYLRVYVGMHGSSGLSPSSATYNGSALTLITTVGSGTDRLFVYGMAAPTATTANVVIGCPSGSTCSVAIHSLYNVDQTVPRTAIGSATVAAAGELSVGCFGASGGLALGACYAHFATTRGVTAWNGIGKWIGSGALSTATSQTSRTPALPSGLMPGDLLIATCASANNATHSWAGQGWTKGGSQTNSGSGWTVSWGWRIYDGIGNLPTVTWSGSANANAQIFAYRDAQPSGTPVLGLGTIGTGTGATHTSTGGNTTAANSLALYLDHALANTSLGTPSGWTQDLNAGSATGPVRIAAGHKEIATSGTGSGNISVTGAAAAWVQRQLEVLAAANAQAGEVSDDNDNYSSTNDSAIRTASEAGAAFNAFGWTIGGSGTTAALAVAECFLPASVSLSTAVFMATLAVWLDPADLTTMKQEITGAAATTSVAVGDPVGSWRNKGTAGGWYWAPSTGQRPILRQVSGVYYLEFDGVNDVLVGPVGQLPEGKADAFYFIAANVDSSMSGASYAPMMAYGNTANSQMFGLTVRNSGSHLGATYWFDEYSGTGADPVGSAHGMCCNRVDNVETFRMDGTTLGTNTNGSLNIVNTYGLTIGDRINPTAEPIKMKVYGAGGGTRALSGAEMAVSDTWIANQIAGTY